MILNKKEIEKIRLKTQMNEMKHVMLTSPYESAKSSAKTALDSLQEKYKELFEQYSEEHIVVNENHFMLDFDQYIPIDEMIKKLEKIKADNEGKNVTLRIDRGDYIIE